MVDQPPKRDDLPRQVSDEAERARAVLAFLRDQEERADFSSGRELGRERVRRVRRAALVLTWVVASHVWIADDESPIGHAPHQQTGKARNVLVKGFLNGIRVQYSGRGACTIELMSLQGRELVKLHFDRAGERSVVGAFVAGRTLVAVSRSENSYHTQVLTTIAR